jgi:hypothetical protein
MAGETGLSQSPVSRIWRAFDLRPHVAETWKLSTDPEFIAKVRDVAGLYMSLLAWTKSGDHRPSAVSFIQEGLTSAGDRTASQRPICTRVHPTRRRIG